MKTELPDESLVRLMVNGKSFSHLLCTPVQLKELAMGWLFSQGIIKDIDDVVSINACDDTTDINVFLRSSKIEQFEKYKPIITSGCMGGQISSLHYFSELPVITGKFKIRLKTVIEFMRETVKRCRAKSDSGGIHFTVIFDINDHSKCYFGSDIGRHNAVDKAIGMALLSGQDFSNSVLTTTGRISSEMVFKGVICGISLMVSQRSVTNLAVELAEKCNVVLISHSLKRKPGIYGKENRVILDGDF